VRHGVGERLEFAVRRFQFDSALADALLLQKLGPEGLEGDLSGERLVPRPEDGTG